MPCTAICPVTSAFSISPTRYHTSGSSRFLATFCSARSRAASATPR